VIVESALTMVWAMVAGYRDVLEVVWQAETVDENLGSF
jgi:hypothetical protein